MATLEFEPEAINEAAARFAAAIDTEPYVAGEEPRPGTQRRHVFDFPDGLRLIVSRDQYPAPLGKRPMVGIHMSASMHDGQPLAKEIAQAITEDRYPGVSAPYVATKLIDMAAVQRFRAMCGYDKKLRPKQVSPSGVLHYSIPLGEWGAFMREKTT
jgi:hypothetical protein